MGFEHRQSDKVISPRQRPDAQKKAKKQKIHKKYKKIKFQRNNSNQHRREQNNPPIHKHNLKVNSQDIYRKSHKNPGFVQRPHGAQKGKRSKRAQTFNRLQQPLLSFSLFQPEPRARRHRSPENPESKTRKLIRPFYLISKSFSPLN